FGADAHPLDLVLGVEMALDSARPAIEAGGLHLRMALSQTPVVVSGDGGRLQQVVGNLLANAIKFTPAGGNITVTLDTDSGRTRLTVADTGPGLSPDFLPPVFDSFRQAGSPPTRIPNGPRLGAPLVPHVLAPP